MLAYILGILLFCFSSFLLELPLHLYILLLLKNSKNFTLRFKLIICVSSQVIQSLNISNGSCSKYSTRFFLILKALDFKLKA